MKRGVMKRCGHYVKNSPTRVCAQLAVTTFEGMTGPMPVCEKHLTALCDLTVDLDLETDELRPVSL